MKTRSAKAKGRRVQNWLHNELHSLFPELEPDDVTPRQMGGAGEDVMLSPAARKLIPCSFECKNVEKLSLHAAMRQAKANASGLIPVVIFKKNRTPYGAAVAAKDLLGLSLRYRQICSLTPIMLCSDMLGLKKLDMQKIYADLLHSPEIANLVCLNQEKAVIMQAVNFLDIIKNANKELKSKLAREASRA